MVKSEIEFASSLDRQGKTWFFEPKKFRLDVHPHGYTPDFFVIEDSSFYEIIASRQAYSYQRSAIEAFQRLYPFLKLVVVNAGAWEKGPGSARVSRVKTPRTIYKQHGAVRKLRRKKFLSPIIKEILDAVVALDCRTIKGFCLLIGMHPQEIYPVLAGHTPGTRIIEKVRELQKEFNLHTEAP